MGESPWIKQRYSLLIKNRRSSDRISCEQGSHAICPPAASADQGSIRSKVFVHFICSFAMRSSALQEAMLLATGVVFSSPPYIELSTRCGEANVPELFGSHDKGAKAQWHRSV